MQRIHSYRRTALLGAAAMIAVAALTGRAAHAQTVTLLDDFEDGRFDNINSPTLTYAAGSIGVTQGTNSGRIDVPAGDNGWVFLGSDDPGWHNNVLHNSDELRLDVFFDAPASETISLNCIMMGDGMGWTQHSFAPIVGGTPTTLSWDFSAVNTINLDPSWQTVQFYFSDSVQPGSPARTLYLDNLVAVKNLPPPSAVNAEWITNGNGTWTTDANWTPSAPVGDHSTATLGSQGGTISGAPVVTLPGGVILDSLNLTATATGGGYTIEGAGVINLDAVANNAKLTVASGDHVINAGLKFLDSVGDGAGGGVIDIAAGASLTAISFRTEYRDVAKAGDGTFVVGGLGNTGFAINGGTVKLLTNIAGGLYGASMAAGTTLDLDGFAFLGRYGFYTAGGSTINLGSGGTMTFLTDSVGGNNVIGSDIVGSGQINLHTPNTLILQGAGSTFTGDINIDGGGTLQVNTAGALGAGDNTIYLGATGTGALKASGPIYGYGHTVSVGASGGTIDTDVHQMFVGVIGGGGPILKMGSATLSPFKVTVPGQLVTVAGGVLQIPANGTNDATSVMGNLSLDDGMGGTGSFDITNNKVIIQSGDLDTVRSQVIAGYNSGSWDGVGIVSSTALSTTGKALGYADAGSIGLNGGSFGGIGVNTGNIVLAYTLQGDSNLDFTVDSVDFGFLVGNYGKTSDARWDQGDYNYDGKVNSEDFNYLAGNFNQTLTFAAPALGAVVPEPSAVLLLSAPLVVAGLGRRRR